jgi:hypothetical protein
LLVMNHPTTVGEMYFIRTTESMLMILYLFLGTQYS